MNVPILPAIRAVRNNDEIITAAVSRLVDNDIGAFECMDDALVATMEPKLGEGFGRPLSERRAGR